MKSAVEVHIHNGHGVFPLLVKGVVVAEMPFCEIRPGEPGFLLLLQRVRPRGYPVGYLYTVLDGAMPTRGLPIGRLAHG